MLLIRKKCLDMWQRDPVLTVPAGLADTVLSSIPGLPPELQVVGTYC